MAEPASSWLLSSKATGGLSEAACGTGLSSEPAGRTLRLLLLGPAKSTTSDGLGSTAAKATLTRLSKAPGRRLRCSETGCLRLHLSKPTGGWRVRTEPTLRSLSEAGGPAAGAEATDGGLPPAKAGSAASSTEPASTSLLCSAEAPWCRGLAEATGSRLLTKATGCRLL